MDANKPYTESFVTHPTRKGGVLDAGHSLPNFNILVHKRPNTKKEEMRVGDKILYVE